MNSKRSLICLVVLSCLASALNGQVIAPVESSISYTTIDYPGAFSTVVRGINSAGDIVGTYQTTLGGQSHGFKLSGGQFTSFDYPGAQSTSAAGINDSGLIVGYEDSNSFTYDGSTFTLVSFPGYYDTIAGGINNAGDIVGTLNLGVRAFEFSGGQYHIIHIPSTNRYQGGSGINNFGHITGYRINNGYQGFLDKSGKFRFFQISNSTVPFGLNDSDIVVGYYSDGATNTGFALLNSKYISLNFPNSYFTSASGINNAGQVVGVYSDGLNAPEHGFITSPIMSADFEKN